MIYEHNTYRSYLSWTLAERIRGNSSYSLRAMARQLEVFPSQLSLVLKGTAKFSVKSGRKIAHKLRLDHDETEYMVALVQLESESNPEIRSGLIDRINDLRKLQKPVRDLTVDTFRQISDWYHCAILELVLLDDFELTPESAARKLGISSFEAQVAIDRLERLELLVRDVHGRWTRPDRNIRFVSTNRSTAMRTFHRQMFEKISVSLDQQEAFKQRLSGFETLPMAPEALPEMNEALEEFFERASRIAKKHPRKSEVYHLGVHFINLTPGIKKEKP